MNTAYDSLHGESLVTSGATEFTEYVSFPHWQSGSADTFRVIAPLGRASAGAGCSLEPAP